MSTQKRIRVVAPCDMQAGYSFMVIQSGIEIPVTVPEGGVRQNESFLTFTKRPGSSFTNLTEYSPLISSTHSMQIMSDPTTTAASRVATNKSPNQWKDGLWDCAKHGWLHVVLWNSIFFPQILAAQVLTRLRMDWCGRLSDDEYVQTFRKILLLVVMYWMVMVASFVWAPPLFAVSATVFFHSVSWGFVLYTWFVLARLRHAVRLGHQIPGHWGSDLIITLLCGCCSISQMARQTAQYEVQTAVCCSPTGLELWPSKTASYTTKTTVISPVMVV